MFHWQAYESPSTVNDALTLLHDYQGGAALMAGGTDLLIDLNRKDAVVPAVIDLMTIPELQQITDEDEYWEIGATVTLSQLLRHQELTRLAPHLMQALLVIGSVQIRNSATLVGNVTNASPAADGVLPLLTLNAAVIIASAHGERVIPMDSFFHGPRATACGIEEMVIALRIPKPSLYWVGAFEKLGLRQAMAIAVVNVAGNVAWVNGKVESARLALGSVGPTPLLAEQASQCLLGTGLEDKVIKKAGSLAQETARPIDDIRGSASYRSKMVRVLTVRCLQRIRAQYVG